MADFFKNEFKIESELIKGGGGTFDVKLDNKMIYSKAQTGAFPTEDELKEIINNLE